VRLFLAIEIPVEVRTTIAQAQSRLKSLKLDASWVKPENIHLTLKFLGETDPQTVLEIVTSLSQTAKALSPFSLSLGEVGAFPNLNNPRVLFFGLNGSAEALTTLQNQVETGMAALGFQRDTRSFSPHLTFGRIKSSRGKSPLVEALRSLGPPEPLVFEVASFRLIESELQPRGAVYTRLAQFDFRGLTSPS